MPARSNSSLSNPPGMPPQVSRVFGDMRFHTDGELHAIAFTRDGKLWSVEEEGVLRQWNPQTGRQENWVALSDLETLWRFSDDGRVLVSASDDLSLWDVTSGQMLTALPQPSWVTAVAFRNDPSYLATGHDDHVVRLWDAGGQQLVREFTGHNFPISALAFSPDGARLASAGEDRLIHLWEVDSGKLLGTFEGHTDRIQALAWHPRGHRLVSAGWDTTARLWDAATFEPIILLNAHAAQVTALAFNPDGSLLACADSANALHIWDPENFKDLQVLKEHEDEIRCLVFSPDGKYLASGGADRVVCLWEPTQGKLLSGKADAVSQRTSLAISSDGKQLASSRGGAGIKIWNIETGLSALSLDGPTLMPLLARSADGRWLAAGGADDRVYLWNAATGKLERTFDDHGGKSSALAFSPDSTLLASGRGHDGMIWVWKIPTGEPVLVVPESTDNCSVETLVFHPKGRVLAAGGIDFMATGGSDGRVALWDLDQRARVARFEGGVTSLAFDSTGRFLAGASLVESAYVWDVPARRLAFELARHNEAVTCVAFSPDALWLATGSDDRTVRLWQANTGDPAAVCPLDTQIKALVFSPDGKFLFTGNGNTTCYQLEVKKILEG